METSLAVCIRPSPACESPMIFPLKDLPEEVRKYIYSHNDVLALPHDDKMLPALLLALAPDKQLFVEALEIYKRVNVRVTKHNIERFKGMRMKELLKFQHLKVICEGNGDRYYRPAHEISFRAHKILLHNNFESITFVFDAANEFWPGIFDDTEFLLTASRTGVKKVLLRLPYKLKMRDTNGNTKRALWRVKEKPTIEGEWYDEDYTAYDVWVWENLDGKSLKPMSYAEASERDDERKALEMALILYEGPRKLLV